MQLEGSRRRKQGLCTGLLVLALGACGQQGGTPDGGGGKDGRMAGGGATFAEVQQKVFTARCGGLISCHLRGPFGGNLNLIGTNAYPDLVGVQSFTNKQKLRVKAGDADNSFLMQKLTNNLTPSEGSPMPKGEAIMWSELPADLIDTVRSWINGGAQNN